MSPIGRVFIVLNLILAGTFVGFAGTHLQQKFNWKTKAESTQTEFDAFRSQMNTENDNLRKELSTMTAAKGVLEQEVSQVKNELSNARDENGRLEASNASLDADLKKLASTLDTIRTNAVAAFDQSKQAYEASMTAQADKDEAIRTRDAAQAENRMLKNQIADLNETVQNKDVQLADASSEQGRLKLLVDVAKAKGFLESMAVPPLAGTVGNVTGNLCTIMVTDNPTGAEIKPGYRFAIYDASGYKGEARVTDVYPERNAALCTIEIRNGDVKLGDKAATQVAGL
ncbi:MAG: hypothetical protein AB7O97_21975 [Planctomycetota bacterium]